MRLKYFSEFLIKCIAKSVLPSAVSDQTFSLDAFSGNWTEFVDDVVIFHVFHLVTKLPVCCKKSLKF
jgi:hypothetical protein